VPAADSDFAKPRLARRLRRSLMVLACLSSLLSAMEAVSHVVEWDTFVNSPARRSPSSAAPAPGAVNFQYSRDETHLLLGRGGVHLYRLTVHSVSFDGPGVDENSRTLAWFSFKNMFATAPPWRWGWYAVGPVAGVRLWPIACMLTAMTLGVWLWRRRLVPAGHCVGCGYDLRPTAPSVRCPECGRA